jgi:D-alanine transaminase
MAAQGSVYLNGAFVERERALVSVDDRGFVFGDGVYEVTRAIEGHLFEIDRHLRRLRANLDALRLAVTDAELASLGEAWETLLDRNELGDGQALVYCQVTRGVAPRAHPFPPAGTKPTVYASATAFTPPAAVRARGARGITVPDHRWARCNIKTVTLLPNVLARQQAAEAGAEEAFFVRDGVIVEGAASNLFAVIDGAVRTHALSPYILPGVTRDVVLEIARAEGLLVHERPIFVEDISRATELFLTGTATDVMPIATLDGRAIGSGKPGPIAMRLYQALMERMARERVTA